MTRASYLESERVMPLGARQMAWICDATWSALSPPLTTLSSSTRACPNTTQTGRRPADALTAEETRAEAADLLRALIDRIELTPNEESKKLEIDLYGDLAGILTLARNRKDGPLDGKRPLSAPSGGLCGGSAEVLPVPG